MNKYKTLYISDLDGTLLNQNAELSAYTKDTLNKMVGEGLYFTVATARTASSAFKILDGVKWRVPLVLLNGVLIYDVEQGRYVQVSSLSEKTAGLIISTLHELKTTALMYQLKNNEQISYYENLEHKPLGDFVRERQVRYNKSFEKIKFSDISPENIIYFTMLDSQEKIHLVHGAFSKIPDICLSMYRDVYNSDLWYLEIHSSKATKQNGALFLRETYGFDYVIGFGDNLNDLPLFAACDIKVAVLNADPQVKAYADYICCSNNDDGVVKWIKENP